MIHPIPLDLRFALRLLVQRRLFALTSVLTLALGIGATTAVFTLLSYGTIKIIQTQFPFPSFDRLLERYGDSSPMGLLWTFMGYSRPYNFLAGACEASGGLLLFFRRTTTLGALVAAACAHRPANPAGIGPPPGARRLRIASLGLKILFIGFALYSGTLWPTLDPTPATWYSKGA